MTANQQQERQQPVSLRLTRRFAASAERVFDAWLDPARARRWLFTTATSAIVRAEVDPRAGGEFVFVDRRDGEDTEHVGRYLELDRPRRLVFTFAVPKYSPAETRVAIDIVPLGEAACELTLTHDGVLPEWKSQTEQGWSALLEGLGREVE